MVPFVQQNPGRDDNLWVTGKLAGCNVLRCEPGKFLQVCSCLEPCL